MIAFDLTHTSHSGSLTGIQKVVRSLYKAIEASEETRPLCFDPYANRWRELHRSERASLVLPDEKRPGMERKAHWSWSRKWKGRLQAFFPENGVRELPSPTGLIVPEFFSNRTGTEYSRLFAQVDGPKVALFYDSIALKLPEFSPQKTVARYPHYLQQLLQFDGIAAISESSRDDLLGYWRWLGIQNPPPVLAIPLACDFLPETEQKGSPANPVRESKKRANILCVSTIEGRKNHTVLLHVAKALWERGFTFELELIGMVNRETGAAALEGMNRLAERYPLKWRGVVSEAELAEAYRTCTFSVYPSLMEGFGLPVMESLRYGKACICSGSGALAEVGQGGGCLLCDVASPEALQDSIHRLLTDGACRVQLEEEARGRKFKTWQDYALQLTGWMDDLSTSSRGSYCGL